MSVLRERVGDVIYRDEILGSSSDENSWHVTREKRESRVRVTCVSCIVHFEGAINETATMLPTHCTFVSSGVYKRGSMNLEILLSADS